MKALIESTTKLVEVVINGQRVPARIWEGTTEKGVPFHAFITRVAVKFGQDQSDFEKELIEQKTPSPEIEAIPGRLIF